MAETKRRGYGEDGIYFDMDALDNIVWTRQTTWPPYIADQVEVRSVEIRPGVYRVHSGNTSGRYALTPM